MHEHEHDHDHAHHCHPHSHEHTGDKPMSPEEVLALLNYMLDHNRHHADELHDICHACLLYTSSSLRSAPKTA